MQSLYRTHKSCGGSGDGSIRCVGVQCLAIHAEAVDLNVEGLLQVCDAALCIHVEVILMGRGDRQSMGSQEVFDYRCFLGRWSKPGGILSRGQPLLIQGRLRIVELLQQRIALRSEEHTSELQSP